MPVETDTELTSLLSDFGDDISFSPGSTYPNRNDGTTTIKGIFDNTFYEIAGEQGPADSSQPQLVCKTSDVTGAERNSMIERGDDVYKVVGVEPDGTGITLLLLEGPRYS